MSKKAPTKKDLEQQVGELTQALQRERADADNVRKQASSEQTQALQRGQESIAEKLLPLLDGLDGAFAHAPETLADNKWVQGVLALDKQLIKLMAEFGLQKIPTTGQPFNPELMQAVSVEEGDGSGQEMVAEELQAGYTLNGKLVRVAMVRVSS